MILHLGDDVGVDSREIVAILNLAGEDSNPNEGMLSALRSEQRVMGRQGTDVRSAVVLSGARVPGGVTENPRIRLSQISSQTLAQRARGQTVEAIREMDRRNREVSQKHLLMET